MPGLFSKSPKLLQKNQKLILKVGLLVGLAGCASAPKLGQTPIVDTPSNIARNAQVAWEKNGAVASADYHFTLAQAYSSEGKVDRAIEEFRAALAYDSSSALLHSKLAAEYLKKGSMSSAIDECNLALRSDAKSIDVRLMLGGIFSLNNEQDKAIEQYEMVLKADPKNDEAAVFKTQVLVEKQQIDEALKFIKSFTSKVKDSAAVWFYAGKLEQMKEHVNEAVDAYRRALALRPGFSQATIALGMIFEVHKENTKAVDIYEAQLEEKQDAQVAGRLVTLYLKANESEKALKLLETLSVLDPEDLNTQLRMGLLHMQKEDWAKAKKVFEAILEKVPDSDKVHYYLAAVYEQEGQVKSTIEQLLKVSSDSKLFEDANLHAVSLYRKMLLKNEALQTLKNAVVKSPENAGFYLVLASMYEDEKKLKDAGDALAQGLKVFPDHEKMRYFYGALLEKQGKSDEALAEMETLLQKAPENVDALNFVGYTWTSQGVHLKDAEEMLKHALKINPNNPFILDSVGWNQFMLGKNEDALVYLEKAAHLKTDEEAILQHLVEVYSKNQMPERAQATRERIHKLQTELSTRSPAAVDNSK